MDISILMKSILVILRFQYSLNYIIFLLLSLSENIGIFVDKNY
jgi:hypothetical protein